VFRADGTQVLDGAGQEVFAYGDDVANLEFRPPVLRFRPDATENPIMNASTPRTDFAEINPQMLIDLAESQDGFTVNPFTGESATAGTAVSVRPLSTETRIPMEELTPERLTDWMNSVRSDLGYEGRYIGGWVEDGQLVLDVSGVGPRPEAMEAGRFTNQQAIYDMDTGELLTVGPAVDSLSPGMQPYVRGLQTPVVQRKIAKQRAVLERLENIESTLLGNIRGNQASMDRLREVIERGSRINRESGQDWYDTSRLWQEAYEAYGGRADGQGVPGAAAAADEWLRAMVIFTAVTSPRTDVPLNARKAFELMNMAFAGDNTKVLAELLENNPGLVTQIFGESLAQTLLAEKNIADVLLRGEVGDGQKVSTFFTNFMGNANGVTVDTHNLAGILYMAGMDYKTPEGRRAIADLLGYGNKSPGAQVKDGANTRARAATWEDADPDSFRSWMYGRVSSSAQYGAFENLQRQLAEDLGMTPREFQANLWVALGDYTGVRDTTPFTNIVFQQLDRVARERNMTRQEVIRAIGNGSLAMVGGVLSERMINEFLNRPRWSDEEETEGEGI